MSQPTGTALTGTDAAAEIGCIVAGMSPGMTDYTGTEAVGRMNKTGMASLGTGTHLGADNTSIGQIVTDAPQTDMSPDTELPARRAAKLMSRKMTMVLQTCR